MSLKVLVADDSPTIQKVIELVLTPENFQVKAVSDGEEALEVLESFKPDIVIADIEMPKLNGYQLCQIIKNNKATAHIPVILLVGAFEEFNKEYAKSVYADDFIVKPFESQELIDKVKSLIFKTTEPSLSGWEEEIPFADEKNEDQLLVGEDFEEEVALLGGLKGEETLKEELSKAVEDLKKKKLEEKTLHEVELPLKEEIREILKMTIDEKISNIISNSLLSDISLVLKDSVSTAVSNLAPYVLENAVRALMKDLLESLRVEIKRIVPEVAEALIKKEIEKITSEIY